VGIVRRDLGHFAGQADRLFVVVFGLEGMMRRQRQARAEQTTGEREQEFCFSHEHPQKLYCASRTTRKPISPTLRSVP
jgi:hypothetical protein